MKMERITSRKNPIIVHLKKLGADASFRRETGEYVCDGEKLFREALLWGADIRCVLLSQDADMLQVPEGVKAYICPRELMEYASYFKSPPGVLFSCALPEYTGKPKAPVIVLENIQDPGNVGTVLRTADAFGVSLVLSGACADPFSPKAVRASMGAVFRTEIFRAETENLKEKLGDAPLYGAALGEGCEDIRSVELKNAAVAIGSEGRGLSEDILKICKGRVMIPMTERCESLNAALTAAVVMWEMKRREI